MPSKRIYQVNKLIRSELGALLEKEIEVPSQCLVTISKAETSPDLHYATVWLSVLPFELRQHILKQIMRQKSELQRLLGGRIRMKYTPKILFKVDETVEKVDKIERLLDHVKDSR